MRFSLTALATTAALTLTLGLAPVGTAAAAPSAAPPAANATDSASSVKNLALVNKARKKEKAGGLTSNDSLTANAYMWSTTMAAIEATQGDGFFHNPWNFEEVSPLNWYTAGENIAYFWGSEPATAGSKFHDMWMNSPGHRANILNPAFTHVGIGIYTTPTGRVYGTQVFAGLDENSNPVPRLTGFGGDRKTTAGGRVNLTVTAGVEGKLQRYSDDGWIDVAQVARGKSTVTVPAPAKVGRSSIYRIELPATSSTSPTWSPALTVTAAKPSRVVSSTWPGKATSVTHGKSIRATVTVRPGTWALERKNPGASKWTTVKKGKANGTTTLKLTLKPSKTGTTTFRLRAPKSSGATARTLTVKVTARAKSTVKVTKTAITRAAGTTAKVTVKASRTARLEKYTGGRWKKIATVKKGTSKVTVKAGKTGSKVKYRVRIVQTTKVAGATSRTLTVTARR